MKAKDNGKKEKEQKDDIFDGCSINKVPQFHQEEYVAEIRSIP